MVTLEYTTREAPTANSYSDTGNRTFRDILKNEPGGVRDKEQEVHHQRPRSEVNGLCEQHGQNETISILSYIKSRLFVSDTQIFFMLRKCVEGGFRGTTRQCEIEAKVLKYKVLAGLKLRGSV